MHGDTHVLVGMHRGEVIFSPFESNRRLVGAAHKNSDRGTFCYLSWPLCSAADDTIAARRGPRVILIRADLERETLGKHACDRAVFVETNRIYQQIHKNTS